ncbi:MAG: galactose-1-phosphate uridylyltransferase [Candidatus Omnitrophica bacterium]|nr:galactose-1-phosphate uridylyltransferase [Candidatus Omnitrophota bacterium]
MPQLRRDPITGRWVIIAAERAKRPEDFLISQGKIVDTECPFCEGKESNTPPEIYALRQPGTKPNQPGWAVRVVPSISPILRIEGTLNRHGKGIYDLMNGVGAHEVVVETQTHTAHMADLEPEQIKKVIDTYIYRVSDLEKDPRFKYVLIFKNYGVTAGSTMYKHSRSQLIATPVNPKLVKEELAGSKKYFDYKERCIYCDILRQELDKQDRVILDIDGFVAIAPFASRFPFETWILPKQHSCDFTKTPESARMDLARILKMTLAKLKASLGDPPYNFIVHTAPFRTGRKAGYWKTIEDDYHWHIEIIPRLTRVAGFEWGTGVYINPTPPEEAAKYLRELDIG